MLIFIISMFILSTTLVATTTLFQTNDLSNERNKGWAIYQGTYKSVLKCLFGALNKKKTLAIRTSALYNSHYSTLWVFNNNELQEVVSWNEKKRDYTLLILIHAMYQRTMFHK